MESVRINEKARDPANELHDECLEGISGGYIDLYHDFEAMTDMDAGCVNSYIPFVGNSLNKRDHYEKPSVNRRKKG